MKISNFFSIVAIVLAAITVSSCNNRKFQVDGTITDAKDSTLYFENMSLNGPVVVDSVKLDADGTFLFKSDAGEAPEFYRLRIADQIINVSIDSTETITVKAAYPSMAYQYEISGSEDCSKIKELALLQMRLQGQINAIAQNPDLGVDAMNDSIDRIMQAYKTNVKMNYIYKEPMKAYAYFALFQTVRLGNTVSLIFNPRSSAEDIKAFAAVATSWDTYYPDAERGKNLHNIAIEGMKDVRIIRNKMAQTLDASKINTSGVLDIVLQDNKGVTRKLTDLKGKVVFLDFHLFSGEGSTKRIMMLRDLYNKYHAAGFEIYQVSIDPDEHFWKTQTAALPWVSVRDENGVNSRYLISYNVQQLPTFYLLGRDGVVYKRDVQIKDIDADVKALLSRGG
ncbi:thioredoxin-like domain-containing protein [Hoylesella oralis]|uniref:thioredoxin-like domain-containing protein n=1 Tax=Hoylesella oralis TaxID=28134 RepID=UPI0028EFF440|nr:thioredoxin-like domain-containing protein [Hoylesella oralis]